MQDQLSNVKGVIAKVCKTQIRIAFRIGSDDHEITDDFKKHHEYQETQNIGFTFMHAPLAAS